MGTQGAATYGRKGRYGGGCPPLSPRIYSRIFACQVRIRCVSDAVRVRVGVRVRCVYVYDYRSDHKRR